MNKVIADRGDSWVFPANTEAALSSVFDRTQSKRNNYYQGSIVDVFMTSDHVLVLGSSNRLGLMSDGFGKIQNFTFSELSNLRCYTSEFQILKNKLRLKHGLEDETTRYLIEKLNRLRDTSSKFIRLEDVLSYLNGTEEIILNLPEKMCRNEEYVREVLSCLERYPYKNIKLLVPNEYWFDYFKGQNVYLQVGIFVSSSSPRNMNTEHDFEVSSIRNLKVDFLLQNYCLEWMNNQKELYISDLYLLKDMLSYMKIFQHQSGFPNVITPNPEIMQSIKQRSLISGFVAYQKREKGNHGYALHFIK